MGLVHVFAYMICTLQALKDVKLKKKKGRSHQKELRNAIIKKIH